MTRIALITGNGSLPFELVSAMHVRPLICALEGTEPDGLNIDVLFSLSRLVPFLRRLGDLDIQTVVMAGAVNRPRLDPEQFDPETASLLPGLLAALQGGDDGALRWIVDLIEDFGFTVMGAADLAPELVVRAGVLTDRAPSTQDRADVVRAKEILTALDPVDVGQGCVVATGQCLGIETVYGTDAMLNNVSLSRTDREPITGGVFVKRAKAGQEVRVDLPTIGPETLSYAASAQLSGICLQADRVIMLEREATLAAANEAGIAIWAEP